MVRHQFTSAKSDGGDATVVRPSNWNAAHRVPIVALGNISGSVSLDVDDNPDSYFHGTANGNITGFTISNATNGVLHAFTLEITQDGTGSRTVSWPAAWVFDGGNEPALSTAAGAVDVISAYTRDGGTTVFAFLTGAAMA